MHDQDQTATILLQGEGERMIDAWAEAGGKHVAARKKAVARLKEECDGKGGEMQDMKRGSEVSAEVSALHCVKFCIPELLCDMASSGGRVSVRSQILTYPFVPRLASMPAQACLIHRALRSPTAGLRTYRRSKRKELKARSIKKRFITQAQV